MIYEFIRVEKAEYPVALLCRVLGVQRSAYYKWCDSAAARAARVAAEDALAAEIAAIHARNKDAYGSPQVHHELHRRGKPVNRKKIERIMRQREIVGISRRRRRSLTRQDVSVAPASDLLGRDFTASAPGMKLVGDITYLPTLEGWLRLLVQRGVLQPAASTFDDRLPNSTRDASFVTIIPVPSTQRLTVHSRRRTSISLHFFGRVRINFGRQVASVPYMFGGT